MIASWLTAILLLTGSVFMLLAAAGVVRLPDVVLRLQASAKASTLGLSCLILGASLQLPDLSSVIRLLSIGAFVMVTAPLSGHIVSRAALNRGASLWPGMVVNEHPPSNGTSEATSGGRSVRDTPADAEPG